MYVVHWPGQTMFGPFYRNTQAIDWCELHFGIYWDRIVKIYAVEEPS